MRTALGLAGFLACAIGLAPLAMGQIVFGPPIESIPDIPHGYDGDAADLDGDGFLDLAFSNIIDHEVDLFFGDGRGHFGPAMPTTPAISATTIAFADLDGDGHAELLTAPHAPPFEFHVWIGLGGAQFSGPVVYPVAGGLPGWDGPFDITPGDVDEDGDVDVTVLVSPSFSGSGNAITVLLNDGSGHLTPQVVLADLPPTHPYLTAGAVADLDGDALPDVVYTSFFASPFGVFDSATRLLLGQSDGSFAESQAWNDVVQLGLVDLDLDGLLDLVTVDLNANPDELVTHLGLGGAQFAAQPPIVLPWPGARAVALEDFDGDAVPDLLLSKLDDVIDAWAVWPGDGRGGFAASKVAYATPDLQPRTYQFAVDVTGDGRVDIVDEGPAPGPPFSVHMLVSSIPNWTYPAGAPQLDLGQSLFGTDGWPGTLVSGSFDPDSQVTAQLWKAGDDLPAFLVAGLSESFAPFKGGVMVPEPDALFGPISTGSGPILELEGRWPGGLPAGATMTLQWWIVDAIAPQGLSASSAVRITQP